MNRLKLLFSTLILFSAAACGGDDNSGNGSGGSGGEIKYDPAEGFKYVQHVNVQNARMIYRKQSLTRADGDDGYWKIDLSGNETRLVITNSEGEDHEIGINKIVKLSDRFLLIDPDTYQIVELLVHPGPDDIVSIGLFQYLSIVDTRTGKMHKWPRELFRMLGHSYDWQLVSAADDAENVYFSMKSPFTDSNERSALYKLDATACTIASLLPEGEPFTGFSVTGPGFVFYWNHQPDSYRVRCPSGAIIPIPGYGFCCGERMYSLNDRKIFQWLPTDQSTLNILELCPAEGVAERAPVLTDRLNGRVLFEAIHTETPPAGCFWAVTFDGTTFSTPFPLPDAFRDIDRGNPNFLTTSKAWYIRSGNTLRKLAMENYEEKQLSLGAYEIRQFVADPSEPDLHFTGYRYADGKEVVGTITEADEIVIETLADSGRILELIALN